MDARSYCFSSLVLAFVCLTVDAYAVDPAVFEAQQKRIEVVNKVAPSVVAIFGGRGDGGGSGVLISPDGYVLTNFHVVNSAGSFMKCGLNDGVLYDAVLVSIDPTGDVAMVKLLGRDDFPYAELGDSDKVKPGDWAYAMGNPFLLATDFRPTVTYGIVSGVNRYQYPAGTFLEYTDCIQIDTSINPGNSGGPLFNDDGELIGINGRGSFEKRGRVNSGAGYAISINQIKNFMGHLRGGRVVDHATLGATVMTLHDGSVIVKNILEQSEAYRRGLRLDDEIVTFGSRSIRSTNQFKNILGIYPDGWKLPLTYRRDGRKQEIVVQLRRLHRKSEMTPGKRKRPQPRVIPRPEKPNDGEKNEGEKKEDDKKEKPKSRQIQLPGAAPAPPAKYKHMYIKKEGFANYYFNKLEQDRVLKALELMGSFSDLNGAWVFKGSTSDKRKFDLAMTDSSVGLNFNGQPAATQLLDGKDFAEKPKGSGGMLMAMHHFQLLLKHGGAKFTEFYYFGSEPLDGKGEKMDVVVSVLTGVKTRWYFDPRTNQLVGFDTTLSPDEDACEVRFQDLKEFAGRKLPSAFVVRSGGVLYNEFDVDQVVFVEGDQQAAR